MKENFQKARAAYMLKLLLISSAKSRDGEKKGKVNINYEIAQFLYSNEIDFKNIEIFTGFTKEKLLNS